MLLSEQSGRKANTSFEVSHCIEFWDGVELIKSGVSVPR
jgi:hypothetical protein